MVKEGRFSAYEKGRMLEKKIEKFFQLNGYKTKRNVVLEGRSGGKHEIDILAEKTDNITTHHIMVECKAWNKPIEKDVVSKVDYIMRDLGLNKAIIVSLKGWRIGAEKTARELGIELWGKDEIERKLGRITLAELETIQFKKVIIGLLSNIREDEAKELIENESKGFLGLGKEKLELMQLVWIPCYLFQISTSRMEGILRRKMKTTKIWNLYEALSGNWIQTFKTKPAVQEINADCCLQPKIKDIKIKKSIEATLKKALEVVRPETKARYFDRLRELGIPSPINAIEFDSVESIFYPVYLGIMRRGEKERAVAVDGVKGIVNKSLSDVLTANLSYVTETLKEKK